MGFVLGLGIHSLLFVYTLSSAPPRHGEAKISALKLDTFDGYDRDVVAAVERNRNQSGY